MCPKFGNNVWHLHSIVKGKLWVLQMLGCKYQHPLLLAMFGRGRLMGIGIKTFWKTTSSSICIFHLYSLRKAFIIPLICEIHILPFFQKLKAVHKPFPPTIICITATGLNSPSVLNLGLPSFN